MPLRDAVQELRELGIRGAAFRAGWEVRTRVSHLFPLQEPQPIEIQTATEWTSHLPLEDPVGLARWMRPLIGQESLDTLHRRADDGAHGKIFGFGRRPMDFGWPIQWHRNPTTGLEWPADASWVEALSNSTPGDIKDCWEVARFPHAYHLARAAAFFPDDAERYAAALVAQIRNFAERNPVGRGVHWASGQEIGFRMLAWLFALDVLLLRTKAGSDGAGMVRDALLVGATEIEGRLDYARIAVYNNHLLSEALALFGVGALFPEYRDGIKWRQVGRGLLDEQAEAQFYKDGAYIQQSHNYHRVALQDYLWACIFARSMGDSPSQSWRDALERSLDFLFQHQNPADGRLPNYGANDGALPSLLTTCDFSDMRPILQVVSLLVRGERLYSPGPWDETAAWFLGVRSLDAPIRNTSRRSVSFAETGFHVARSDDDTTFAAFRCGTLRDRFSQIDMLNVDYWWRGQNVIVDAGSYRYNAADVWHEHFTRTGVHNTVSVDGRDQMLHYRRFKVLYWTHAQLLGFRDDADGTLMEGEHYGYRRHAGHVVHRRSVLLLKTGNLVVVDCLLGEGVHDARLHWLCGDFAHSLPSSGNGLDLETPAGTFGLRAFSGSGEVLKADVKRGVEPSHGSTPRGWLSRYYGERVPVPSVAFEMRAGLPQTFVTLLGSDPVVNDVRMGKWTTTIGKQTINFEIRDGRLRRITVVN